jgi:hypothetical protein
LFNNKDCLRLVAELRAGLAIPVEEEGALRACSGEVRVKLLRPDCLLAALTSLFAGEEVEDKLLKLPIEDEEIKERGRGGNLCPPILTLE